ncbi:recombinase family protein [Pseudobacteroides cellulosolvens]|uniref:Recombinase n=1 Tax=Pseudobacteroides cellulosolvens ATCC 35603 = DSM 2933 TaxID=398512 RepID=A0A0L6JH65_9FIRM|nr:recombinase family protein [Pseudobacteroides cellulosolvens]KNY24807.1 Recombinase [Pseudobacteroides cellulosolvens ATCC 35603 = DSM 2933]
MENYCIYLRKSRADEEIEKTLGEGETLAKHRKTLLEFSKKMQFNIVKIHEELVSGESLLYRPAMLELLKEVEQGLYAGVIVMDQQRLGRGDMEEQGIILKTFKKANTKIITPDKTYDLNNEFDEEYSEFEAFMSRKEYKMINKRLQRGVIRSVHEGNYLPARPPYGYLIKEDKFSRTLVQHPEQSHIIKLIFDWYVNDKVGFNTIANNLNSMGLKTLRNQAWTTGAVSYIIKNPVYIGKISWKKVITSRSTTPGKLKKTRTRPESDWIVVDGKHEALIDADTFEKAQIINKSKYIPPVKPSNKLSNCLAGLVVCGVCGYKMKYRPYPNVDAHLICERKCGNKSSKYKYIEARIIKLLDEYADQISANLDMDSNKDREKSISALTYNLSVLEKEMKDLGVQRERLHDLLEQGVYDIDTFLERSKNIADRLLSTNEAIKQTQEKIKLEIEKSNIEVNMLDKIKNIVAAYYDIDDPVKKNTLLKEVLEKAVYTKVKGQREDNFSLEIYPNYNTSLI